MKDSRISHRQTLGTCPPSSTCDASPASMSSTRRQGSSDSALDMTLPAGPPPITMASNCASSQSHSVNICTAASAAQHNTSNLSFIYDRAASLGIFIRRRCKPHSQQHTASDDGQHAHEPQRQPCAAAALVSRIGRRGLQQRRALRGRHGIWEVIGLGPAIDGSRSFYATAHTQGFAST